MKDRIKFNDAMLAAVMEGRKTQTRRPIDKETLHLFDIASEAGECFPLGYNADEPFERYHLEFFPYGEIGGIINLADKDGNIKGKIEITDVWLQQLRDITLGDICKEIGCGLYDFIPATYGFQVWEDTWRSIYGEESWNNNPWVWVIEFRRID
ncbi:hypothetical protein [Providencia alcalifaciens]|uniref:hypothetical protein n=1 Tax=Providencia alcalifaciens TaxID=126385 RepID=UPI001CC52A96|nr:hypothetical protein [Providencia alcalifaciens]CAG9426270.1 hypothetical protein NVI2019_OHEONHNH_02652 [Providencia alcalifaciens]CAG9430021.1 hypothetical protein NVI2019_PLFLNFOB_03147 [Providencia alcalifaciens]CAG9430201.1 hypothetical protein NVI2019_KOLGMIGM_03148 [Providencia alcalifaciens]CAG9431278.1 hypothetical protein NVI2019_OGMBKCAO_03148 [Providencia alcalifaciens]CAG9431545.1 hypothetical protein NVI2019_ANGEOOBF_03147 [Providencia alcalifaciens]